MKRTIMSMLGALAVAAGFFLFGAPAANATHNGTPPTPVVPAPLQPCQLRNFSGQWPNNAHYFYCGANPALFLNTGNVLANVPAHLRTKLFNNNTYLFVWEKAAHYDAYRAANPEPGNPHTPLASDYRVYGVTNQWRPGGVGPVYTTINVFEKVNGHATCAAGTLCEVTQDEMGKGAYHEQGHALDIAYGLPSRNSTTFSLALAADFGLSPCTPLCINARTESQAFPHGIPTPFKATSSGWVNWMPPTNSPQPNIRNELIIKELYPQFFAPAGSTQQQINAARAELWVALWVQYNNNNVNYPWTNPYAGNNNLPGGYPNGTKTLSYVELFGMFQMTKHISTAYFHKLWTNSSFVP